MTDCSYINGMKREKERKRESETERKREKDRIIIEDTGRDREISSLMDNI